VCTAEDEWRDPAKVALANPVDSVWHNHAQLWQQREAAKAPHAQMTHELEYQCTKEVCCR
jgi:nuclear transport factor 2 (NTF2) superfamily protein